MPTDSHVVVLLQTIKNEKMKHAEVKLECFRFHEMYPCDIPGFFAVHLQCFRNSKIIQHLRKYSLKCASSWQKCNTCIEQRNGASVCD